MLWFPDEHIGKHGTVCEGQPALIPHDYSALEGRDSVLATAIAPGRQPGLPAPTLSACCYILECVWARSAGLRMMCIWVTG